VQIANENLGRQLQTSVVGAKPCRQLRLQRSQIEAMRALLKLPQAEAIRPEAKQQIQQAAIAQLLREPPGRTQRLSGTSAAEAAHRIRQIEQDLEIRSDFSRRGHQGLHVARRVSNREQVEREIEMVALQAKTGRKDQVRVAGGLIAIE